MLHGVHCTMASNVYHQKLLLSIFLHFCIFSPCFSHNLYESFVGQISEFLYIFLWDSHPQSDLFCVFCIVFGLVYVTKVIVPCNISESRVIRLVENPAHFVLERIWRFLIGFWGRLKFGCTRS